MIFVILRHRKMRTVTNFFLANLAAADLCVGIFCVLPNLIQNLSPSWVLGPVADPGFSPGGGRQLPKLLLFFTFLPKTA